MKKAIVFMLAISLLTACSSETKSSETAEVNEITEAVTMQEDMDYAHEDNTQFFNSLNEFKSYMQSEQKAEDFPAIFSDKARNTDNFKLYTPVYDETKYQLIRITFVGSSYEYSFKDLESDTFFMISVMINTYYHTFEEMVEDANANLLIEPGNAQVTVWGDTPALIQTVQFSNPVEYSIRAMIDENNCAYLSAEGMTPEELTSTLNDITFE